MDQMSFLSSLTALAGFLWVLFVAYRASFKTDEVRHWAKECITTLQGIAVLTNTPVGVPDKDLRLANLAISSSVLLEQGRLYFKNRHRSAFGTEKHPAYRGFRPAILDELLVAHQVALRYSSLSRDEQAVAGPIAQSCERRFVSLVQMEVGRIAAASRYNEKAGQGLDLDWLIAQARAEGKVTRLKLDF